MAVKPAQSDPADRTGTSITFTRAQRIFERAVSDPELCPLCFDRNRRYYPEEDEAAAERLRPLFNGGTTYTLEAAGHEIRDGRLVVNTATSDPDPSTFQETVPPTRIEGEYYPARGMSICSCGTIDYPEDNTRRLPMLYDAFDNLIAWYDRLDLSTLPAELDRERGRAVIGMLRDYDQLAGQDKLVLTEAIRRGLGA